MSKLNKRVVPTPAYTHEGTRVQANTPLEQLRRAVMSCLLWEDQFYEDGQSIVDRIRNLIPQVDPLRVADLACYARESMKLRHVPLLIAREMARLPKHKQFVADVLEIVIQRPDELGEFLAIYFADNPDQPLSNQVKQGLARAFSKFNAYQLAKYNRDAKFKLRDVMFLVHPKPLDAEQAKVFRQLANKELSPPDTWEVALSAGADKAETFSRLLAERKLGAMALLRNLRNMQEAGVSDRAIRAAIEEMNTERVLPFRFITAARYAPGFEDALEKAMFRCLEGLPKLPGKTALVIDTSPSMWQDKISAKSDMNRFEAAAALTILARELCEEAVVYAFNHQAYEVPNRRGFALRDALAATQGSASCGGLAVDLANQRGYDRIIILTDGQWHRKDGRGGYADIGAAQDVAPNPLPGTDAYLLNVASYQNGIGQGRYTVVSGWSESVLTYITEREQFVDTGDVTIRGIRAIDKLDKLVEKAKREQLGVKPVKTVTRKTTGKKPLVQNVKTKSKKRKTTSKKR